VLAGLGAARGLAEESTFRRAFATISPDRLDQAFGAWPWTRSVKVSGQLVTAIDGKAIRGAKDKDGKAPHLADVRQRGAGRQHARGGSVAQAVRENGPEPAALRGSGRDLRDRAAGQRPVRARTPANTPRPRARAGRPSRR
jgi:hypothetical protein